MLSFATYKSHNPLLCFKAVFHIGLYFNIDINLDVYSFYSIKAQLTHRHSNETCCKYMANGWKWSNRYNSRQESEPWNKMRHCFKYCNTILFYLYQFVPKQIQFSHIFILRFMHPISP